MVSKVFHPGDSGSLGEARQPRSFMADERRTYRLEKSRHYLPAPTILIAEDLDDNRSMMRKLLEMKGYSVMEAEDGERAIEVALFDSPDLILLDLKLPNIDGIAVTRRLREEKKTAKVPIVMLSGWDSDSTKDLAVAAGCNEYLSKPVNFDRLDTILSRYVPLTAATKSRTPRVKTASQI